MRRLGILVAVGFLLASAFMNFQYGHSLGRSALEAWVYGLVGVLAVACNALCPFFMLWHRRRRALLAGVAVLWLLCLTYSLTSAIGFAAENRQALVGGREAVRANYETTIKQLSELEEKRLKLNTTRFDNRIDGLREELKKLRGKGGHLDSDPQSVAIATLTFLKPEDVRTALLFIFAVMVEFGAALVLFAALSSEPRAPAPATVPRWRPNWRGGARKD